MKIARTLLVTGFLALAAATHAAAQVSLATLESEITRLLLKKDLRQAVKEAESAPASDLKSLFWRLSLYNRAADAEKVSLTARQIVAHADFGKNPGGNLGYVQSVLKNDYFEDAATIRFFLENGNFDGDLFGKLMRLCAKDAAACGAEDFDRFLGQKAAEAKKNGVDPDSPGQTDWTGLRVDWRRRLGMDEKALTNRYLDDVRNDPADLKAALRFIKFFRSSADIRWLAETFASPRAYDYYELGERVGNLPEYSFSSSEEAEQIRRSAIALLLKSLEIPFGEKDVSLIYAYRFRYASVPVTVKNPEKQLRFWTKTALAENYRRIGEPQNAQPIVEELSKLDKSDIFDASTAYLSGAVQAQSGARVVEAEILRRQAERQDTYQYWHERILYYQGRNEVELVFSSYLQAFAAVPFDLKRDGTKDARIFYVRRFADYAREKLQRYADDEDSADWDALERRKHALWKDAESFLRGEFERTKSHDRYSFTLAEIIVENRFNALANEILSAHPELLIKGAKSGWLDSSTLPESFFKNPQVPQAKKDLIFNELLKIAGAAGLAKALVLFEAISTESTNVYNPKLLPLVEKNFKRSAALAKNYQPSGDDSPNYRYLAEEYGGKLFYAYLSANDRRAAEKLMTDGYYTLSYGYASLIENAARAGAFDEALAYWKKRSNLNRENLESLAYLKNFPPLAEKLRAYYAQMKKDEPASTVPDKALAILR